MPQDSTSRLSSRQRCPRDLLEVIGELGRVPVDVRLVFRRDRLAEERRQNAAEHGRRMRVRARDREPFTTDAERLQAPRDLRREGI